LSFRGGAFPAPQINLKCGIYPRADFIAVDDLPYLRTFFPAHPKAHRPISNSEQQNNIALRDFRVDTTIRRGCVGFIARGGKLVVQIGLCVKERVNALGTIITFY
jgi:hypothetical protein